MDRGQEKTVELDDAVSYALDEARMILPGIQALFGFQLIAVFNERFAEIFLGAACAVVFAGLWIVFPRWMRRRRSGRAR